MYLTRFPINRTRRATRQMLGSPYRVHAAVAGSFPSWSVPDQGNRALWRIDLDPGGPAWLYILSESEPSLVGLDEQIGFPDRPPAWQTRPYDGLLSRLAEGQLWSFRLVANPVRTVTHDRASATRDLSGKRVGHVTSRQQASWLIGADAYTDCPPVEIPPGLPSAQDTRAARNGFDVPLDDLGCAQVVVSDRRSLSLHKRDSDKPITLVTARFDGVLRITDVAKLRHALTHGIGHAKAFGCGLLTLASLPSDSR
ncbi:MAG: type I-E CRISPR-associated protein Cas6/Cse3/CasE [Propionibacteriaceae bacterium]|jgi:CRISPR system Cascade subunit CasE|nr:type I-E CRISPR-associated protein Cas6/Cse3/CasE [Propionibacteriaceae bacterium]